MFPFRVLCILLQVLDTYIPGCWAMAWFCYLSFVTIIAGIRGNVRDTHCINGNAFEDWFACLFLYPCVGVQLESAFQQDGLTTLIPVEKEVDPCEMVTVIKNNGTFEKGKYLESDE